MGCGLFCVTAVRTGCELFTNVRICRNVCFDVLLTPWDNNPIVIKTFPTRFLQMPTFLERFEPSLPVEDYAAKIVAIIPYFDERRYIKCTHNYYIEDFKTFKIFYVFL